MYIKVSSGSEEKIHSLDGKNLITIGRSNESDIVVPYEGISRKHLRIHIKQSDVFVEDVGSSHGSFMNNEKLEPGELTPFNSFFPVVMGENVNIELVDEMIPKGGVEPTKTNINVNSIKQEATRTIVDHQDLPKRTTRKKVSKNTKGRRSKVGKKRPVPIKKDNSMQQLFSSLIIVAGIFYILKDRIISVVMVDDKKPDTNIVLDKSDMAIEKKALARKEKLAEIAAKEKELEEHKKEEQRKKNLLSEKIRADKCLSSFESSLCSAFESVRKRNYYEGFRKTFDQLDYVVELEGVRAYTEKLEYSSEQLKFAQKDLKKLLGRYFSPARFQRDNFKTGPLPINGNKAKLFLFSDFIYSGYLQTVLSDPELKTLNLIMYNDSIEYKPVTSVSITIEELKKLSTDEDLKKYSYYSLRSYETMPIGNHLKRKYKIRLQSL